MKTKVVLGLSLACLLFSLGGLIIPKFGQAQVMKPKPIPVNKIVWDFDSGWEKIIPDQTVVLSHKLGGDPGEYLVYLTGKLGTNNHQYFHGGIGSSGDYEGAWWYGDDYYISIYRGNNDNDPSLNWTEFRVRILKNQ